MIIASGAVELDGPVHPLHSHAIRIRMSPPLKLEMWPRPLPLGKPELNLLISAGVASPGWVSVIEALRTQARFFQTTEQPPWIDRRLVPRSIGRHVEKQR